MYLMYNDEVPDGSTTEYFGHTKGNNFIYSCYLKSFYSLLFFSPYSYSSLSLFFNLIPVPSLPLSLYLHSLTHSYFLHNFCFVFPFLFLPLLTHTHALLFSFFLLAFSPIISPLLTLFFSFFLSLSSFSIF